MSTQMQTCAVCGGQVPVGSRFCQNCGHAMTEESPTARVESITPPQGSPAIYPVPQYDPGSTSYSPQSNTASLQSGQYSEAPRQPQYSPATQSYTPPPPSLYGQQPPQGYAPPPQSYSNAPFNPAPGYGSHGPAQYAAQPQRDSTLALLLELIGYVGVLGIGHIYAGRTSRGVGLMIGWFFYGFIAVFLLFTLVGAPVACLMALLWPLVPILSGLWAKTDLDKERAAHGPRY